jgi:hypothetical protein
VTPTLHLYEVADWFQQIVSHNNEYYTTNRNRIAQIQHHYHILAPILRLEGAKYIHDWIWSLNLSKLSQNSVMLEL